MTVGLQLCTQPIAGMILVLSFAVAEKNDQLLTVRLAFPLSGNCQKLPIGISVCVLFHGARTSRSIWRRVILSPLDDKSHLHEQKEKYSE